MQTNEVEIKTIQTTSEEEFIMKPYIDWCFKELMRNPKTRTGFIAALLRLPPEQIGRTTILENELSKRTEEEKQGEIIEAEREFHASQFASSFQCLQRPASGSC